MCVSVLFCLWILCLSLISRHNKKRRRESDCLKIARINPLSMISKIRFLFLHSQYLHQVFDMTTVSSRDDGISVRVTRGCTCFKYQDSSIICWLEFILDFCSRFYKRSLANSDYTRKINQEENRSLQNLSWGSVQDALAP